MIRDQLLVLSQMNIMLFIQVLNPILFGCILFIFILYAHLLVITICIYTFATIAYILL